MGHPGIEAQEKAHEILGVVEIHMRHNRPLDRIAGRVVDDDTDGNRARIEFEELVAQAGIVRHIDIASERVVAGGPNPEADAASLVEGDVKTSLVILDLSGEELLPGICAFLDAPAHAEAENRHGVARLLVDHPSGKEDSGGGESLSRMSVLDDRVAVFRERIGSVGYSRSGVLGNRLR